MVLDTWVQYSLLCNEQDKHYQVEKEDWDAKPLELLKVLVLSKGEQHQNKEHLDASLNEEERPFFVFYLPSETFLVEKIEINSGCEVLGDEPNALGGKGHQSSVVHEADDHDPGSLLGVIVHHLLEWPQLVFVLLLHVLQHVDAYQSNQEVACLDVKHNA